MSDEVIPRLVLHFGPPKTANTSLQYFLQDLARSDFHYGGARQPRTIAAKAADRLHRNVNQDPPKDIGAVLASLLEHMDVGQTALVSEELFLVDGQHTTHQQKIARLAGELRRHRGLLGDYPLRVAMTLRDPVEGLRALYSEIHWRLPDDQQADFEAFLDSNQARVFDYRHLAELFEEAGFEEVTWLRFEDLTGGRLTLADLTGDERHESLPVHLPKVNLNPEDGEEARHLRSPSFSEWAAQLGLPGARVLRMIPGLDRLWSGVEGVVKGDEPRRLEVPADLVRRLRQHMAELSE